MKSLQIANARETFFKDKEHYLAFRQQWKNFINEGKAKKKEVMRWGEKHYESELVCKYHLFYVLMIGKDGHRGFVEHTRGEQYHYTPYWEAIRNVKGLRSVEGWSLLKDIFGETLTQEMIDLFQNELSQLS